jgi:nucleoside-diphosphate-sugar epimerase
MPDSAILVTGANGFTGRNLCLHLAEAGHKVRGMYYVPDGGEPGFSHPNLELVPGDLTDGESLERALDGVEVVHNVAALYRPANVSNEMYFKVNVEGVRDLVERAARRKVKRFVHCSTIGIYGHVEHPPATEESPIKPDDVYQESKLKGEEIAMGRARELGLEIVCLRPAAIYGPLEQRFLKLARAVASGQFVMFGNGEVPYQFAHVKNLSLAFELAAAAGREVVGEAFIIADEKPLTLNRIVGLIGEEFGIHAPRFRLPYGPLWTASLLCEYAFMPLQPFGLSPPLYRRRAEWFRAVRWFDVGKAKRMLGYQPRRDSEEGLREMVRSYVDAGWLRPPAPVRVAGRA